MNYYAAPMEGLTDRVWRQAHQKWFGPAGNADRYYAPFISPPENRVLIKKKMAELAPAANPGAPVIPQLLAKDGELAAWMIGELRRMGYTEVNLNFGCPSGTVTAKGKGSGMLRDPQKLDAFLDAVFSQAGGPVSVKTRLGVARAEEFGEILNVYNKYPLCELTIHPRVMKQLYRGQADREAFAAYLPACTVPVCYNGDLFSVSDTERFLVEYPDADDLMFGRGMLIDPALVMRLRAKSADPAGKNAAKKLRLENKSTVREDAAKRVSDIRDFYGRLAEDYAAVLSGERDVLFKMKELWSWQGQLFEGSEKYLKKIRKAQKLTEYKSAVAALFADCPIKDA